MMRDGLSVRAKCFRLISPSIRFARRAMFYGLILQTIFFAQMASAVVSTSPQSYDESALAFNLSRQPILITWEGLSPDGKLFVRAENVDIKVWDVESGKLLKIFKGKPGETYHYSWSIAFSPNSKLLASGSEGNPIRVWDIATGNELNVFKNQMEQVNSIDFSPDGKMLASAGKDKTIRLWNVASGKLVKALAESPKYLKNLSFSPDGELLVGTIGDKTVSLWDVASGRQLKSFEVGYASFVAFLASGKTLAIYEPYKPTVYRGIKDEKEAEFLNNLTGGSKTARFSPNGKIIAFTKDGEKTIRLWDVEHERELQTFEPDPANSLQARIFSNDGKMLAAHDNKTIKIWDVKTGKLLNSINSRFINLMRLYPHGKLIGFWGTTLYKWDLKSGKESKFILK